MARKTSDAGRESAFEELLAEAEALAEKMEEGGLSLDESIRAYEKGVLNLRRCADLLRAAEEKVQVLLEKNGTLRLEELDAAADGNGEEEDEDGY